MVLFDFLLKGVDFLFFPENFDALPIAHQKHDVYLLIKNEGNTLIDVLVAG